MHYGICLKLKETYLCVYMFSRKVRWDNKTNLLHSQLMSRSNSYCLQIPSDRAVDHLLLHFQVPPPPLAHMQDCNVHQITWQEQTCASTSRCLTHPCMRFVTLLQVSIYKRASDPQNGKCQIQIRVFCFQLARKGWGKTPSNMSHMYLLCFKVVPLGT